MMERNELLKSEIGDFRKVGHQFVNNEINANEFKAKSGGMGVYAQRGGEKFMIRLRTPSGIVSRDHLALLTEYTKQYPLPKIHLTTRQAIQLHDLSIDHICDIMEDAIDHKLYTRGGGGNFPRNVALSPLSGVEKNEEFDVTQFALRVNEFILDKVTTYKLPRKLKISFSNSSNDAGNATINDLGFIAVIKDGEPYFEVYLAGGLGNNPAISIPYDELVKPEDVLYHVEAFTNLFIAEGDFENKAKARSRYIPKRIGENEFVLKYKEFLKEAKENNQFDELKAVITESNHESPDLKDNNCLIAQKQEGLFTVILHPVNGQLLKEDLEKINTFVTTVEKAEVRLSMTESMYVRNLTAKEATTLLDITANMRQITKIEQSVSCVGVPTCQIGIEKSQALIDAILQELKEKDLNSPFLPSIHVSGCGNSCSRHQVSIMGFTGRKKRVNDITEDVFELHIGGKVGKGITRFGTVVGTLLDREIPLFMRDLASSLEDYQLPFDEYIEVKMDDFNNILKPYLV
jgi:ferredoxin-nitrite reductase